MKLYIGTSGYYYSNWKKYFYPINLSQNDYLKYYSNYFNSVEINNTFYKIPSKKTITKWYNDTPTNFKFIIKMNNYITHYKKLTDIDKVLKNFLEIINLLKKKIILYIISIWEKF